MKGLSAKLVRELSHLKHEPQWVLDLRLRGVRAFQKLKMPTWAPDLSELDLAEIETYIKPEAEMATSWDEVPEEIRATFDALGIPESEKSGLAGVGAQYDSEVIYHHLKNAVSEQGVVYLPIEEALTSPQYAELVKQHFMQLVPPEDHPYAALHAAVFSGGSFIYVPPDATVEIPLQSYYRLNAPGAGQFEHTLIIVDEAASLHFIEGCSAPRYNIANLHAGSVEIFVGKNAHMKFSTVENWSKNLYNLNTKRATVAENGRIEWVTGSFGSKVSMLYPTTLLQGRGAQCDYTGVTFAGQGQTIDNGAKVIHLAPDTSSTIRTKSLSKADGTSVSRTLAVVTPEAKNAKAFIDCKSLLLNQGAHAAAVPEVKVDCLEAEVAHEASVGRISEEALFYLQSRGIPEVAARGLIVRGFTSEISKQLPIEYAMEMNNLIKMELEGTA